MALSGSFKGSIVNGYYRLRVDWSATQSIANNTSTITAKMYLELSSGASLYIGSRTNSTTIDGSSLSYSSSSISTDTGGITRHLGTVSKTITHNDDGTRTVTIKSVFNIKATISGTYYGSITASATVTLDAIPRTSTITGGSGNIGSATTISINRATNSFTHNLYFSFGTIEKQLIASNVQSSYSWTIPTSLYAQLPTSNSGTGTLYCETYSDGTLIGTSEQSFTANVINSNPTFSSANVSYSDTNSTVVGITGNNQHIVRNQSNLKVTFSSATPNNSATILKYEITFNGSTQTKTSASTIDYGKINLSSNTNITIKVIDSRGNSTTVTKTITIFDWILPTAEFSLNRLNNYEDTTYLKVIGKISSVNSKNSIQSIKYRYKKTTDTSYSAQTTISNNTQHTFSLQKEYAWNIEIVIADKFGSTSYVTTLPKGMPVMFIDIKKLSVGINCFPSKNNSFELNGKTIFDMLYPVGSIYMSINSTSPANLFGGTWTQISGRFLYCTTTSKTTGGANSVTFTPKGTVENHTLTTAEIPEHTHQQRWVGEDGNINPLVRNTGSAESAGVYRRSQTSYYNSSNKKQAVRTMSAGGSGAHNHGFTGTSTTINTMPSYFTVYCWYRTA